MLLGFNIDEEVEFGDEVTRLAKNIKVKGNKANGERGSQSRKREL